MAIRESSLNGAKWSLLSSIKIIGIGVLQLSLLAQILQANELNLLAIAVIALLAIDTLADRGFSNTLIRRSILSINDLSTIYWGNMLMGGRGVWSVIYWQPSADQPFLISLNWH
ncbi:oligosaccharide flippase family protein [Pantoea agglomerans]|nr:oligosaccharide flippase family protein [Pantoea agglomerans]